MVEEELVYSLEFIEESIERRIMIGKWLCSVESDKYVHLLVCVLIVFLVGQLCHLFIGSMLICTGIGFCCGVVVGVLKELHDSIRDKEWCYSDLVADLTGLLLGVIVTLF